MQIPQQFPQFDNQKALLIVAGEQAAVLYYAHKGEFEKIDQFDVPNPTYSDREGFFMRRGHGKTYGSGAVHEEKDTSTRNAFLEKFQQSIDSALKEHNITDIILCVPKHLHNETHKSLPADAKNKLLHTLYGNFTKETPKKLLGRIKKIKTLPSSTPATSEAQKILDKVKGYFKR